MRYTSSHPHAFRNRIAKSIGVLVATALVATLGLPSHSPGARPRRTTTSPWAPAASHTPMRTGFTLNWTTCHALDAPIPSDSWIVTVTNPNGTKTVVNKRSTGSSTLGAVSQMMMLMALGLGGRQQRIRPSPTSNDLGTWWFQVTACFMALEGAPTVTGHLSELK